MKLPFYTYEIDDDDSVIVMDCNSLVDVPAHMKAFVTFKDHRAQIERKPALGKAAPVFRVFNEEERLVMGVMISAGTPIYRNDPDVGEYYGVFTKTVITKIKERLMRHMLMHNMNTMHEDGQMVEGAHLVEIFQVDSKRGIAVPTPLKSQNLQDGTLIGTYKITDNGVWSDIKAGKFRGFSIEAYLGIKEAKIKTNMKKTKVAKGRFAQVSQINKWAQSVDQDSFEVGDKLTTTYENSLKEKVVSPLSAGEYTTEEGKQILVDSNGVIRLVFKQQTNMSKKKRTLMSLIGFGDDEKVFATAKDMDGTVLSWEGDLAAGVAVMIDVNEEKTPAPGGEYQLTFEDGTVKMVTIDDAGLVTAVEDVEEMSAMEVRQEVAETMQKVFAALKEGNTAMGKKIAALEAEIKTLKGSLKDDKFSGKGKPNNTGDGKKLSLTEIIKGTKED